MSADRPRPAWDEVQHKQRRDRERVDAEHAANVAALPDRPGGVWRVCGQPLTLAAGCGCTCHAGGPWPEQVSSALARLRGAS